MLARFKEFYSRNSSIINASAAVALLVVVALGWLLVGSNRPTNSAPNLPGYGSAVSGNSDWQYVGSVIAGNYADANVTDLGNGTFRMYYSGVPTSTDRTQPVYSATTTDGVHWQTEPGIRKTMVAFPDVIRLPGGRWRMYFQQTGVIDSATSSDGLSWTDDPGVRIDTTNSLGLSFDNVGDLAVLLRQDGTYLMVYDGRINQKYPGPNVPNSNENVFMWATSTDGLSWTKQGMALDSRNSTYRGWVEGPDLVRWDDGSIRLYYWSYDGIYYTSFSNGQFASGKLTLTTTDSQGKHFTDTPIADPTLLKIGSTWYMYYGQYLKGISDATLTTK